MQIYVYIRGISQSVAYKSEDRAQKSITDTLYHNILCLSSRYALYIDLYAIFIFDILAVFMQILQNNTLFIRNTVI